MLKYTVLAACSVGFTMAVSTVAQLDATKDLEPEMPIEAEADEDIVQVNPSVPSNETEEGGVEERDYQENPESISPGKGRQSSVIPG